MKKAQGLTRAKDSYQDRSLRARQLRTQGSKILGYLCAYSILEMITALDLVPFRILGDIKEPVTEADACLPQVVCPFLRSVLDLGLKGKYDFLDGVVMAHTCDVAEKTAHIWHTYLEPPYFHFIDTPHTASKEAVLQHKELIRGFQKSLETFAGKKVSPTKLGQAITSHNRQRALVRELYRLRKADPPPISGTETLQVMVSLMSLPVEEGSELLEQVISEVKERPDIPIKRPARLLVWGSIIDNTSLVETVEKLGASIVMDDTCVGSRFFWPDVELTPDPLDGLAYRYLVELRCPRTLRRTGKDYQQDLEARFGYLGEYIKEWKVDGFILQSMRYCDIHGYEVPQVGDYLKSLGIPSIYIEQDYSRVVPAQLNTRLQAFLEMIKGI
jgi:benzoyl-CoA reductase/2-hydroxyglutaryl-CoA dehydratase subunit BcrC/BadD/HgdB